MQVLISTKMLKLKQRRKLWLNVHLVLGLVLGLLCALFGITGSLLVFHTEIDQMLNPQLLTVKVPEQNPLYLPFATLLKAADTSIPKAAKLSIVTYPINSQGAVTLNYSITNIKQVKEKWQLAINPYTAEINGKRLLSSSDSIIPKTFIRFIFILHYDLFLGASLSPPIVGSIATLLLFSVLTGLIVWWPLTGRWRQAFSFKANAGSKRFNYDLHKTTGFSSALLLIMLLLSGIFMVIPEKVIPLIELFSPTSYCFWVKSTPAKTDTAPIGMDAAVAAALQHYPTGRLHWVFGANNPDSAYVVCQDGVKTSQSFLQHRCLVMDRYTGTIIDDDDPTNATAGEVLSQWQWPLHSGQAFALPGRLVVFMAGLACPILFITGLRRWLHKRQARVKSLNRPTN